MIARDIFYSFNPRTRLLLRRIWYFPVDFFTTLFRKRNELVPPKGLIFTGAGDFIKVGDTFAEKIIEECALPKDGAILDIGCGIGRIAKPFTNYLNSEGSYYGFDIVPEGVKWCKRHYNNHPHFHFDYIPLRNDLYNLSAVQAASEFRFPYEDSSFHAACAISVFTHMQEGDVRQYFHEIARTLKTGGSCLATFFIITEERLQKNNRNINIFFRYGYGNFYLHDNNVKDANIAFRLEVLEQMANGGGLEISDFLPGWWADQDKENKFDFQDVLVLRKRV